MIAAPLLLLLRNKYTMIVAGATVIIGLTWFHGFSKGKSQAHTKIVTKIVEANKESKKGSDDVRMQVQSYSDIQLDAELCRLGIVRQNSGCK